MLRRSRVKSLAEEHTPAAIRRRLRAPSPSYLHDFVYGAIDGTITTFAIVAGVAGAQLSPSVVIILGGANLIADGFSMAVSNYLGSRAETQRRARDRREEERHIRLVPEGEREEVRQIFSAKGFEGENLERAVDVVTGDPDVWADTMMVDELGYGRAEQSAVLAATATLLAFVTVGFLPLAAFVYDLITPGAVGHAFAWSAALTGLAFLVVGSLKARYVEQAWWRAGLETLSVGGTAAVLAYATGAALQGVA